MLLKTKLFLRVSARERERVWIVVGGVYHALFYTQRMKEIEYEFHFAYSVFTILNPKRGVFNQWKLICKIYVLFLCLARVRILSTPVPIGIGIGDSAIWSRGPYWPRDGLSFWAAAQLTSELTLTN